MALKEILDEHADDPTIRSRFVLEAEITGNLEHPGIVPVYGLGVDRRGPPVLRHAVHPGRQPRGSHRRLPPGPFGARSLPRERCSSASCCGRFIDVCKAIAYAHSRGVLHRDLKPDNVMLGSYGETLIVDWGLAKALGHAGAQERPEESRSGKPRSCPLPAGATSPPWPGSAHGDARRT